MTYVDNKLEELDTLAETLPPEQIHGLRARLHAARPDEATHAATIEHPPSERH